MSRLKTTREKALHQVERGRRRVTARQFNQPVRDYRLCSCCRQAAV